MAIFDKKKKTEKPAAAADKKKAPAAKKTAVKKKTPAEPKAKKALVAEIEGVLKEAAFPTPGDPTTDEKLTQLIVKVENLISDIAPECAKGAGFAGTARRDQRRRLKALAENLGSILD